MGDEAHGGLIIETMSRHNSGREGGRAGGARIRAIVKKAPSRPWERQEIKCLSLERRCL